MAGNVSGLHVFAADTGPVALSLLDGNYGPLTAALNTLANFSNSYLDSGAVNALVVTVPAPQVFSYSDGILLQVKVAATSTVVAPTINVNGLGLRTIVNPDGSALAPGQLALGAWVTLQYNAAGAVFMLVGGVGFAVPKFVVGPPGTGISTTLNGVNGVATLVVNSANGAAAAASDVNVFRTGSTANAVGQGPSLTLQDQTTPTATQFQHAGGQTEVWQFNLGQWNQVLKVASTRAVTINAPAAGSGPALSANGAANLDTIKVIGSATAGQSFGLNITAGTTSADMALRVSNQASSVNYFGVRGDGLVLLPGGTQPAFSAERITTAQAITASTVTDLVFNQTNLLQGAGYATGTGVFTAPVAGVYFFMASVNLSPGGTNCVLNGMYFSKNNATTGAGLRFDMGIGTVSAAYSNTGNSLWFTGSALIQLAANDTVRMKWDAGTSGAGTNAMGLTSKFEGYLLG